MCPALNRPVDRLDSQLNSTTHPKVKAVEWRVEVVLGAKAIHLHGHLCQKQAQEHKLGQVCPGRKRKHTDHCTGFKHASLLPVHLGQQQTRQRKRPIVWENNAVLSHSECETYVCSHGMHCYLHNAGTCLPYFPVFIYIRTDQCFILFWAETLYCMFLKTYLYVYNIFHSPVVIAT